MLAGRRGLGPLSPEGRTGSQELPNINLTEELQPRGRSLDLPSSTEMDMLEGKSAWTWFAFRSIFKSVCPFSLSYVMLSAVFSLL